MFIQVDWEFHKSCFLTVHFFVFDKMFSLMMFMKRWYRNFSKQKEDDLEMIFGIVA